MTGQGERGGGGGGKARRSGAVARRGGDAADQRLVEQLFPKARDQHYQSRLLLPPRAKNIPIVQKLRNGKRKQRTLELVTKPEHKPEKQSTLDHGGKGLTNESENGTLYTCSILDACPIV